jgi:aryl-alcohol dehydrogenase-like predicted oxidoreductase
MEQRRLGNQGLVVSAVGLGCMGMSWAYGPRDEAESVAAIRRSDRLGRETRGPKIRRHRCGQQS